MVDQTCSRSRPTQAEIAVAAGVSVGTVERVLNQRGGVRPEKVEAVFRVAQQLGYRSVMAVPTQRLRRVEILLPSNPTPFWGMLDTGFVEGMRRLSRHYVIHRTRYPEADIAALRRAVAYPPAKRDALIVAPDAGEEICPSLQRLIDKGTSVITLVTQVPGLSGHTHIGIDNVAAGKTAAQLMRGLIHRDGIILLLATQSRRVEHRQRVEGFCEVIGGQRSVRVVWTEASGRRPEDVVASLMGSERVAGIYDSGHDAPAIRDVIRASGSRPAWIAHECSSLHLAALSEGLMDFVLDQDAPAQAAKALQMILQDEDETRSAVELRMVHPPRMQIICRENMP